MCLHVSPPLPRPLHAPSSPPSPPHTPQEELREGSGSFLVHAYLPVEASFGLADEMRRRSSGAASASLLLSHWERLQVCVSVCVGGCF